MNFCTSRFCIFLLSGLIVLTLVACDTSTEEMLDESSMTPLQSCSGAVDTECGPGEFCRFPDASCGALGEPGTCELAPTICTLEVQPVCGCNGVTFANFCAALGNSVSVFSNNSCESVLQGLGQICGGAGDLPCQSGLFCEYEVGSCGGPGSFGTCQEVPINCPLTADFVCGCDGNTYQNGCFASAAGTTIETFGSCQ